MKQWIVIMIVTFALIGAENAYGASEDLKANIYNPGKLKPVDSRLKVSIGDMAPDFELRDVSGEDPVCLSAFRGQKPVALLFGSYT